MLQVLAGGKSRLKFLFPMLIVFPLGLLATSVVFDFIHLVRGGHTAATVAHALTAAGLVGGVLAAPWGLVDWLAIPSGTRAKTIGALHGGGNVIVLALFAASWWLRSAAPTQSPVLAYACSFGGAGIALITAWLGGELVDRLGVGVSPHASLNARSSLSGPAEPASTRPQA
jgi:uncharacterized membrane protein